MEYPPLKNPSLNNGISATMALESSNPFGVSDNPVPKGRNLFAENNEAAPAFMYPFNASRNFTSAFSGVTFANSLHSNVNHIASTNDMSKSQPGFNAGFGPRFKMNDMDGVDSESGDEEGDENMDEDEMSENEIEDKTERGFKFPSANLNDKIEGEANSLKERDLGDLSDSNEEPVECGNCDSEFRTLQEYMDHSCAGSKTLEERVKESNVVSKVVENHLSDVESFDGKIVYNPDGSAYIIEGDSDSELESIIDIPQKEGLIIDRKGKHDELIEKPIPQIDNAFFVPRNPNSFMNSMYMLPHKLQTPIMHSYRVYDLRSQKNSPSSSKDKTDSSTSLSDRESSSSHVEKSSTSNSLRSSSFRVTSVPTKPILMCFICKLSFGFAKSFTSHAINEHSMVLSSEEMEIMSHKNSSAIIQGIGKEKEPLMSFLEPIKSSGQSTPGQEEVTPESVAQSQSSLKETTSVSYVYAKPKVAEPFKGLGSKPSDLSSMDNRKESDSPAAAVLHALQHKTLSYDKLDNSLRHTDKKKLSLDLQEDSNSSSGMFMNHSSAFMQEDLPASLPSKSYAPHIPSPMLSRPNFLAGCEEHPHGRAQGVECPNCDMILSSSQSLGGHMTMMHSRNSCKTLKCPKCNWHYKYQETLEIHMKEKHPDSDQKCMYCLTNQSHPRLARGESYSCGYKPYRCEVCNYSTTTKGNLSIHMQSDKHLNNVQDLANGGGEMKLHQPHPQPPPPSPQQTPPQPPQTPSRTPPHQQLAQQQHQQQQQQQQAVADSLKKNKPKPTWRCDVCNYETNVARNLRIHMTSEKHTHNMMVLQQNMKHMQRDMQLHQMNQLVMLQQDPSFLGLGGPIPGGVTFPYDGSLMLGGLPTGFGEAPMDLSKENGISLGPNEGEVQDVSKLFQCCVCNVYGSDSLENLHQHLQQDRTKQHESENIVIASGTYICNLCTYKTNLKANFQLHCKTDKHLQRLQLVNHIKEGGDNNEWRLKYLNVSNPIQVRCNACDYYTNSINKLQIHTGNPRHEASAQLFCHLQMQESKLSSADKYYHCVLCKFNARSKLGLMQHVHSMQHLHNESLKQIEMKETGQMEIDIGDIFVVKEIDDASNVKFDDEDGEREEERNFVNQEELEDKDRSSTSLSQKINNNSINSNNNINNNNNNNNNSIKEGDLPNSKGDEKTQDQVHAFSSVNEMRIKAHILAQHSQSSVPAACPLCQESLPEKSNIEAHLKSVHNVNAEGLQRLLQLVENTKQNMPPTTKETLVPSPTPALAEMTDINVEALEAEFSRQAAEDAIDTSVNSEKDLEDNFRCQTCTKAFTNIDQLYAHQNELGHLELKQTPRGPGYLCWKKGCNQYFITAQALQMHFREIHAKRMSLLDKSEYKFQCPQCTLAFKSPEKLQQHAHIHLVRSALICSFCTKSFHSVSAMKNHVEVTHDLNETELEQYNAKVNVNVMALATLISNSGLGTHMFTSSDSTIQSNGNDSYRSDTGTSKGIERMDMDDSDEMPVHNSDYSSKENSSSSSTPVSMENGFDKLVNTDVVDKDSSDMNSEQIMFEDYINSQAFAEGAYEDPSRKYKCHRCRVAFTKQHYLLSHNKTLLHKRGERLSYPMEKYLDPNRPYKCDVCKESFTQKNILLVHYNSVSHLHKVKQAQSDRSSPTSSAQSSSSHSSVSPMISTVATTASSSEKKEKSSANLVKGQDAHTAEDDVLRPYKCNICKVSYSQGSTLDIHIRSVAHQTKASKIQELAMSGEIDLSKPLIEEPSTQAQQQKMITDILNMQTSIAMTQMSQPSMLFQGLPGGLPGLPGIPSLPGLPMIPGLPPLLPLNLPNQVLPSSSNASHASSSTTSKAPLTSSNETVPSAKSVGKASQHSLTQKTGPSIDSSSSNKNSSMSTLISADTQSPYVFSGNVHMCPRCCAVFESMDLYIQHQMLCLGSSACPSPLSPGKSRILWRVKPHVQRNLLENFGFECVMQFNEFNQAREVVKEETEEDDETDDDSDSDSASDKEDGNPSNDNKTDKKDTEADVKAVNDVKVKEESQEDDDKVDLPEMNKCVCKECGKQFSSVWVLKAHQEEVHRDIVPIGMVEDVGDQFKSDMEKKIPVEPEVSPAPPTPSTPVTVEETVVKQEMPPPPAPQPQMQMDMLQMMSMFGMMPMPMPSLMMNSQPPMMPMMIPPPGMDQGLKSPNLPVLDTSTAAQMSAQHKQQMQQAAMANQKRARTRINDEQLKVLRGYFDINNSPSEEQIQAMSETTGLPMKVIKHWFRNTLFKERQRNKDSPYNFNNPPSTTLDLEEYEKTGKLSVVENPQEQSSDNPEVKTEEREIETHVKKEELKEEPEPEVSPKLELPLISPLLISTPTESSNPHSLNPHNPGNHGNHHESHQGNPHPKPQSSPNPGPQESQASTSVSRSPSPTPHDSLMDSFGSISSQGTPIAPSYPPTSTTPIMPPLYENHNYSPPGGSQGRRANRTRFSDYQVKVLQEYFEQNAYPKDDELEHLSKILKLSPRVIVVWFQNARQKARKIYENQPPDGKEIPPSSSATSPFQRTPGLNYQCKKCSAVFQRYYDLIRHQKRSCFSEAEKLETHMMSDDSDSLSHTNSLDDMYYSDQESETSSNVSKSAPASAKKESSTASLEPPKYRCESCDMSFHRLELWREHQNVHNMNPGLFMSFPPTSGSAFDVLQNLAAAQQQQQGMDSSLKRKYEEDRDDDPDQPRDKRLRTTILPEQLDYLYQKYQVDCNPSRKQLEAISKDVGLKKRVVQVWFQNTRARERKGQYRAHQQLIHKRCPICRALFRAKSALESHLATKHPDEMAKGEINVDAIPDAAIESPSPSTSYPPGSVSPSSDFSRLMAPSSMQGLLPLLPPANLPSLPGMSFPPMADPIQLSMKQFYEDSFKKYINELSSTPVQKGTHPLLPNEITSTPVKSERPPPALDDDAPLDLSKPVKKASPEEEKPRETPSKHSRPTHLDTSYMMQRFSHDTTSESMPPTDYRDDESSNFSSNPASPGQSHHHLSSANKRYRTQMTSLQVRIMKSIFIDYKTPTMAECEMLGRIIGLQKRVVQVWFQNARAKEKKAKLNMAKAYGQSDMDFPKPPEECTLCNFKYSHKYTIQDHIFTKKHIDKLRTYIQTQSDAERELTHSSMSGPSGLMRSQQASESEVDNMRKLMEEASVTQTQMAQLQSMGLGPLGLHPSALGGMGPLMNPADFLPEMKKESSREKERKEEEKKIEGSTKKEPTGLSASEASQLHGLNFLSPFGGFMPGMDPGLLPLMYPGLPGLMGPGMPPIPPGLMPGSEHLLGYDPMTFGTPLPLLQIPQQAIRDVSSKLMDPKASVGQYTQDCKSISSLKTLVRSADYNCAREATVDVGYICKKCQMVYPAKDACVNHQRMMCFPGGKAPEGINPILKLEQIQYECKLCSDKVSSVQEFKHHCQSETHTIKLTKYQQQKAALGSSMKSYSSSSATVSATVTSDAMAHIKERTTPTRTNLIGSFSEALDQSNELKVTSEESRKETDNSYGAD